MNDFQQFQYIGGVWRVEIINIAPMDFAGDDLTISSAGLFMTHRPVNPESEMRHSFVPWHRVVRAYQLTKEKNNG